MLTTGEQLMCGPDHFLLGWNGSAELLVRLELTYGEVDFTRLTPRNPWYRSENHQWMFHHLRGDVLRRPSAGPPDVMINESFVLFGRSRWMNRGTLYATYYWMKLFGLLPIASAAAVGMIVSSCCERQLGRRGVRQ